MSLHIEAAKGNFSVVEQLLREGADPLMELPDLAIEGNYVIAF